jgi:hypothetical protein
VPLSELTGEPAAIDIRELRNSIVLLPAKLVPLIVTRLPTCPDVGDNDLIVGGPEAGCATAGAIKMLAANPSASDEIAQPLRGSKESIAPGSIQLRLASRIGNAVLDCTQDLDASCPSPQIIAFYFSVFKPAEWYSFIVTKRENGIR